MTHVVLAMHLIAHSGTPCPIDNECEKARNLAEWRQGCPHLVAIGYQRRDGTALTLEECGSLDEAQERAQAACAKHDACVAREQCRPALAKKPKRPTCTYAGEPGLWRCKPPKCEALLIDGVAVPHVPNPSRCDGLRALRAALDDAHLGWITAVDDHDPEYGCDKGSRCVRMASCAADAVDLLARELDACECESPDTGVGIRRVVTCRRDVEPLAFAGARAEQEVVSGLVSDTFGKTDCRLYEPEGVGSGHLGPKPLK